MGQKLSGDESAMVKCGAGYTNDGRSRFCSPCGAALEDCVLTFEVELTRRAEFYTVEIDGIAGPDFSDQELSDHGCRLDLVKQ
jgi:hypothetical protein